MRCRAVRRSLAWTEAAGCMSRMDTPPPTSPDATSVAWSDGTAARRSVMTLSPCAGARS